ncbi:AzlD domain-containing protein [Saccharomonospora xinjiangensis]|uniref:Branched-chain amino acid transport protein (AzlD) n=1 Tax=Saccharomonospora xinjiangensis XJ-54 TaxID=882086 RepID=I0UXN0_9PSEU|nr:AzlD domain-containing protein [Saccharomonospora xinjiangensis]EID52633.1 Branched-chain amino acid transport protein (AzlD) [Saccharomonospora xinjiangensis XJ-54]
MLTATSLLAATAVLGAGTFAFRAAGPVLKARVRLSPRAEKLFAVSAVVLLACLVATSSLVEGSEFAGWARPAGVAVGGALAWKKAPFVLVVLAAGATAAGLRLLGVP